MTTGQNTILDASQDSAFAWFARAGRMFKCAIEARQTAEEYELVEFAIPNGNEKSTRISRECARFFRSRQSECLRQAAQFILEAQRAESLGRH